MPFNAPNHLICDAEQREKLKATAPLEFRSLWEELTHSFHPSVPSRSIGGLDVTSYELSFGPGFTMDACIMPGKEDADYISVTLGSIAGLQLIFRLILSSIPCFTHLREFKAKTIATDPKTIGGQIKCLINQMAANAIKGEVPDLDFNLFEKFKYLPQIVDPADELTVSSLRYIYYHELGHLVKGHLQHPYYPSASTGSHLPEYNRLNAIGASSATHPFFTEDLPALEVEADVFAAQQFLNSPDVRLQLNDSMKLRTDNKYVWLHTAILTTFRIIDLFEKELRPSNQKPQKVFGGHPAPAVRAHPDFYLKFGHKYLGPGDQERSHKAYKIAKSAVNEAWRILELEEGTFKVESKQLSQWVNELLKEYKDYKPFQKDLIQRRKKR